MWMEPPATTSAPEPTEPSTITSPFGEEHRLAGAYIGLDHQRRAAPVRRAVARWLRRRSASTASTGPRGRLRQQRRQAGSELLGATPSRPMMRMPRSPSSAIRWAMAGAGQRHRREVEHRRPADKKTRRSCAAIGRARRANRRSAARARAQKPYRTGRAAAWAALAGGARCHDLAQFPLPNDRSGRRRCPAARARSTRPRRLRHARRRVD